jgi:diaminohydroxyphosphoribosylaminopyrimidine deaminase/5-amino-6-(5-phosphoribosylamino)uracil reductase
VRVVLDRNNRIPKNAKILTMQDIAPTWLMSERTITEVLQKLTERGITSILVEAGAKLTTEFLESGLVDRTYLFRAPITIGENGLSVKDALGMLASFKQIEHIALGNDSLDIYETSL